MKKILLTLALAFILLLPYVGFTAETKTYTFLAPLSTSADQKKPIPSDLPGYLQSMFQIVLGVAGVLAVIMIMRGGIMYITAGDNESSVSEAKEIIRSAIFGLLLAILSFLIIQTLNPNALNFSIQKPTTVPDHYFDELPKGNANDYPDSQGMKYRTISKTGMSKISSYKNLTSNICETILGPTWHSSTGCTASTPGFFGTDPEADICCAENQQERASYPKQ